MCKEVMSHHACNPLSSGSAKDNREKEKTGRKRKQERQNVKIVLGGRCKGGHCAVISTSISLENVHNKKLF